MRGCGGICGGRTRDVPLGMQRVKKECHWGHYRTSRLEHYEAPWGVPLGTSRDIPFGTAWDITFGMIWGTKGHPIGDIMGHPTGSPNVIPLENMGHPTWDNNGPHTGDTMGPAVVDTKGHGNMGLPIGNPTELQDTPQRTPRDRVAPSVGPLWDVGTGETSLWESCVTWEHLMGVPGGSQAFWKSCMCISTRGKL